MPPSLLAVVLLQTHDRVSDASATERAFAKSILQLFRAHLVIHEKAQAVFMHSLEYARQREYLKGWGGLSEKCWHKEGTEG